MRPWTETSTGYHPSRWWAQVSSGVKYECTTASGTDRRPKVNFIDEAPANRSGSTNILAAGLIAAFGNSDGDLEMLEWATNSRSDAGLR